MSRLAVLDAEGASIGVAGLSPALAAQPIRPHLIHETVTAELAARRAGSASTKTRGEVRGGGRKPWRQKGTGRARQGSIRAPQWTGGGVVFGPTPRSYGGKVNRKVREQAFRSALRAHAERGSAAIMQATGWTTPSTKRAAAYLAAAPAELATGSILLVVDTLDGVVARSFRNLARITVMTRVQVETTDLMQARGLLVEREIWERMAGGDLEIGDASAPAAAPAPTAPEPKPTAETDSAEGAQASEADDDADGTEL